MKREDVKNKIPGITDEQLNWIMQENGADINREKSAAGSGTEIRRYCVRRRHRARFQL